MGVLKITGEQQQSTTKRGKTSQNDCIKLQLLGINEVSDCLKFNPYILSGYRPKLTHKQCILSILQLHNETGNIWTHLLPLLTVSCCIATGVLPSWPGQVLMFWMTIVPIGICLMLSVTYHVCMAQVDHYKTLLCVDVTGIYVLFIGMIPASFVWGLQCQPSLLNACLIVYITALTGGLVSSIRSCSSFGRAVPMFVMQIVRLIVFGLRVLLENTNSAPVRWYIVAELSALIGGIINVAKIPEKWVHSPCVNQKGLLDYWFNSHQIMHVLVVVSISSFIHGTCLDYQFNVVVQPLCNQSI